jgi:hypothetical protein
MSILRKGFYFTTGLLIGAILQKEVISKMTNYIVTRSFQDKNTGENFGIGQTYQATDERRASELEKAGFIAAENSQSAQMAKQQANQTANQGNVQSTNQNQASEPMTIINGKAVPVSQANQAMEQAEAAQRQSGIQAHHDNSSEPVQAGQTAQQQTVQTQAQPTQVNVRPANVQSGGEHLENHLNSGAAAGSTGFQAGAAEMHNLGTSTTSAESQQMANQQTQQSAEQAAQEQQSKARAARTKKAD